MTHRRDNVTEKCHERNLFSMLLLKHFSSVWFSSWSQVWTSAKKNFKNPYLFPETQVGFCLYLSSAWFILQLSLKYAYLFFWSVGATFLENLVLEIQGDLTLLMRRVSKLMGNDHLWCVQDCIPQSSWSCPSHSLRKPLCQLPLNTTGDLIFLWFNRSAILMFLPLFHIILFLVRKLAYLEIPYEIDLFSILNAENRCSN